MDYLERSLKGDETGGSMWDDRISLSIKVKQWTFLIADSTVFVFVLVTAVRLLCLRWQFNKMVVI